MNAPAPTNRSLYGLQCPRCDYSLTGLPGNVCPECGEPFDPKTVAKRRRAHRRRMLLIALVAIFSTMYLPYAWLLFIDYPWSQYRWSWISLWPGLPLLLPFSIVARPFLGIEPDDGAGRMIITVASVLLGVVLIWIAKRGVRAVIITALVVLVLSLLNSWCCYHGFRM